LDTDALAAWEAAAAPVGERVAPSFEQGHGEQDARLPGSTDRADEAQPRIEAGADGRRDVGRDEKEADLSLRRAGHSRDAKRDLIVHSRHSRAEQETRDDEA
jgi:hypothetical protein